MSARIVADNQPEAEAHHERAHTGPVVWARQPSDFHGRHRRGGGRGGISRRSQGAGARGQGRLSPARDGSARLRGGARPQCLTLAAEEINAGGGVKSLGGARITLLPGDTQNKVELGNSEASRLIDQGAVAVIGPFSSLVAFSVRQVTEKNRTPFLLLAAVADNLTEGGLKYTFRMQPNGKAMAT
jgi:branched-chain amino acid transport system substrate-binding protein